MESWTSESLEQNTVPELAQLCKMYGLPQRGRKAQLIERLLRLRPSSPAVSDSPNLGKRENLVRSDPPPKKPNRATNRVIANPIVPIIGQTTFYESTLPHKQAFVKELPFELWIKIFSLLSDSDRWRMGITCRWMFAMFHNYVGFHCAIINTTQSGVLQTPPQKPIKCPFTYSRATNGLTISQGASLPNLLVRITPQQTLFTIRPWIIAPQGCVSLEFIAHPSG